MTVRLQVQSSPDTDLCGKAFAFDGYAVFLFGRSPDAHCRSLKDPFVSRNHFLLEIDPPKVLMKDLRSSNGTKLIRAGAAGGDVQAVPAGSWVELVAGDHVIAGKTEFLVMIEAVPVTLPTAEPTAAGPVRRRCQVLSKLVEGGMASVFKVRDPETGQDLAMKVIRPGLTDTHPITRQQFLREMSIWKGLNHPNVIRFVEDGIHDGALYILMEFAPGGSAADLMAARGGRLDVSEVVTFMRQVLAGLAHLHRRDLVHRDMKPGNMLITLRDGKRWAKIGDFGLARNFEQAGRIKSHISEPGLAMGSAGYMPKEQLINFKFVKPSGDVFAAGAAFYHMLTGEEVYPVGREDPFVAILDGNLVPIEQRLPDIPKGLAAVISKALQPEPENRFPDATSMLEALEIAGSTSPTIP